MGKLCVKGAIKTHLRGRAVLSHDEDDAIKEYRRDVEWLRSHVARDDIYDFAQQCLGMAEYFMVELNRICNLFELTDDDRVLQRYVINILSLQKMKDDKSTQMINTELIRIDDEDNHSR